MKSEWRAIPGTITTLVTPFHSAGYPMSAVVKNPGPGTVFLGGANVTTSNGFPLETNQAITVDLVNEPVYAVATVTTTTYVFRRGD